MFGTHRYSWSLPVSKQRVAKQNELSNAWIPIGGRCSYGDTNFNSMGTTKKSPASSIEIDQESMLCVVDAGVTLRDLSKKLQDFGLSIPVLPGAMSVTVGGAIASDVHGKSSHVYGSFCSNVVGFWLSVDLSSFFVDRQSEWWKYTVGGLGLTGLITKAILRLVDLPSTKILNRIMLLESTPDVLSKVLDQSSTSDMSVAWIKGHPGGKYSGYTHSVNFVPNGDFSSKISSRTLIQDWMPSIKLVNDISIKAYSKIAISKAKEVDQSISPLWSYVFPNSTWGNWNYMFGKRGFHEVQINAPFEAIVEIAEFIEKVKKQVTCFLIGIKVMRGEPEGYFSFLRNGYSIALNFCTFKDSELYVNSLYSEAYNLFQSKIHLTKDWAINSNNFEKIFESVNEFRNFRTINGLKGKVESDFSRRLNI